MTRFLLAACAAFALTPFAFASDPPAALSAEPPVAAVATLAPEDAIVQVNVAQFGGTGVCVAVDDGQSLVLSNRHIVNSAQAPVTISCRGKKYDTTAVYTHPQDDLALIIVKGELPGSVTLASEEPAEGSKVSLYGYAWNGQGKLLSKEGKCLKPDGLHFQSTLAPVSGDSGGGVFNEDGELVSINHGFLGSYEQRGAQLGVRVTTITTFTKQQVGPRFPRLAARLHSGKGLLGRLFHKADPPAAVAPKKAEPPKAKSVCPKTGGDCTCKKCDCPNCPGNKKAAAPVAPPQPQYRVEYFQSRGRTYYQLVPVGSGSCAGGNCPLPRSK